MNYKEAENTIIYTIESEIKKIYPDMFILTPNVKRKIPDKTHLEIHVRHTNEEQIECGPNVNFRYYGVILMPVRVMKNTGTNEINEIIQKISDIIRGKIINGIVFRPVQLGTGFETENFYQQNVNIPFYYNVVHNIF